jgi:hypothetical protein
LGLRNKKLSSGHKAPKFAYKKRRGVNGKRACRAAGTKIIDFYTGNAFLSLSFLLALII